MTDANGPTVHASAVRVGDRAVLIRGPSGAGKSRLAFDLIVAGRAGQIAPAVLIGDDRGHFQASRGQLGVGPARALGGRIGGRGPGIRRCPLAGGAGGGVIVGLSAHGGERLPPPEALLTEISGVQIPRVPVAAGATPFPMIVAALTTSASSSSNTVSADCSKGFGNHIWPTIATE